MNGRTVASSFGPLAFPLAVDRGARPERPQHVRERGRADGVDRSRPARRFERLALDGHLVAGQEARRAELAQARDLVLLAGRRPDLVAALSEDRHGRATDATQAPVTSTGPSPGVRPRSSSATTDMAAVKPAVPIAIASRAVSPLSGTTQPAGTRWYSA